MPPKPKAKPAAKKRSAKPKPQKVAYVLVFREGRVYRASARADDGTEVERTVEGFRSRSFAYASAQQTWPGVPVHYTA